MVYFFYSITQKWNQNKVLNIDSLTGVVYIKMIAKDGPKVKIRYKGRYN